MTRRADPGAPIQSVTPAAAAIYIAAQQALPRCGRHLAPPDGAQRRPSSNHSAHCAQSKSTFFSGAGIPDYQARCLRNACARSPDLPALEPAAAAAPIGEQDTPIRGRLAADLE